MSIKRWYLLIITKWTCLYLLLLFRYYRTYSLFLRHSFLIILFIYKILCRWWVSPRSRTMSTIKLNIIFFEILLFHVIKTESELTFTHLTLSKLRCIINWHNLIDAIISWSWTIQLRAIVVRLTLMSFMTKLASVCLNEARGDVILTWTWYIVWTDHFIECSFFLSYFICLIFTKWLIFRWRIID